MLRHLLTTGDKQGRDFWEHIWAYNPALDFASLGVNLDKELANARRGVYTFRIHGPVHHYTGQLTPREGEAPSFAQIYIHDGTDEGELENRQRHLGEACLPELRGLQDMLNEVNSGDNGWHLKIPHSRGNGNITHKEYYSYHLIVRSAVSYLHLWGRLYHQYLVDMYAKYYQVLPTQAQSAQNNEIFH